MPSGTDRRCDAYIFHFRIGVMCNVQGLFHKDIRAITLTLFLLWSVTNLVYYGTIFGIEVRTRKSLDKRRISN